MYSADLANRPAKLPLLRRQSKAVLVLEAAATIYVDVLLSSDGPLHDPTVPFIPGEFSHQLLFPLVGKQIDSIDMVLFSFFILYNQIASPVSFFKGNRSDLHL
jgi:hypothetical protein